jgi:hypothetical protein
LLQPTFRLRGFGRRGEAAASVDALRALADTVALRSRSLLLNFGRSSGNGRSARGERPSGAAQAGARVFVVAVTAGDLLA